MNKSEIIKNLILLEDTSRLEAVMLSRTKTSKITDDCATELANIFQKYFDLIVKNKIKACERAGIKHTLTKLPLDITQDDLIRVINQMNNDDSITGFIVQLPLPNSINTQKILMMIKKYGI